MIVINLFSGPGAGKSSIASDLFALMKWKEYNVELINEYAKILTWEKRHDILRDQLYLLAKQNRMLERLKGQVDYVITDSPLLLCKAYAQPDYFKESFFKFVDDLYDSYNNINIFLNRKKKYFSIGRNQTEDEAKELDKKVKKILLESGKPFIEIDSTPTAREAILELLSSYK